MLLLNEALLYAVLSSGTLLAQLPGNRQQAMEYSGEGKLEAVQGQVLKVTLDGKPWLVKVGPATKLTITGTAEVEFLRPGLIVMVVGEFEHRTGKATAPIAEISIITPDPVTNPPGITQEGADAFNDKPRDNAPTGKYKVVGQLSSIKGKNIQIGKMKAELADDVKIPVAVTDPRFMSIGDSLTIKGWYYREGELAAQSIEAEMAAPLKPPSDKSKGAKSAGKRGSVRDAQDLREKRRDLNRKGTGKDDDVFDPDADSATEKSAPAAKKPVKNP